MKDRCELFRTLWLHDPEFRRHAAMNGGPRAESQNLQRHHIWGGTARIDEVSNLIRLCSVVHDFAHMRPIEMRIACHWRQRQLKVLDWGQMDRCAGSPGKARRWCETQTVSGIYAVMQKELLEWTVSECGPLMTATGLQVDQSKSASPNTPGHTDGT